MRSSLFDIVYAAIPIVLVAVAALIFFVVSRRRGTAPGEPARLKNVARIVAIAAFVYGLLASFAAFAGAVVTIAMVAQGSQGGGGLVLPVAPSSSTVVPESVLPPLEVAGQLIGFGYFSEVTITGAGLSVGAALLYYSPTILTPLLHAIVAFGISSLATRIERQSGFVPELTRSATVVGASLIVLGSLSQVLHGYGVSLARVELLGDTELAQWLGPGPLDLTHVAAGVAVLLLGVLLRRGVQLERDTKGLV